MKNNRLSSKVMTIIRVTPFLTVIAVVIIFSVFWGDISVNEIINYVPESYILALLMIILIYSLKSLSVIFPLGVLYISVGIIFPPPFSILVNVLGLSCSLSIPYWIGRASGQGLVEKLSKRFKRLDRLEEFRKNSDWFTSYILRMIGIIPGDVVSLSLGAFKLDYIKYLTGSIVGLAPRMIATTLVGNTITDPDSAAFICLVIMTIIITIISIYVQRRVTNKRAAV